MDSHSNVVFVVVLLGILLVAFAYIMWRATRPIKKEEEEETLSPYVLDEPLPPLMPPTDLVDPPLSEKYKPSTKTGVPHKMPPTRYDHDDVDRDSGIDPVTTMIIAESVLNSTSPPVSEPSASYSSHHNVPACEPMPSHSHESSHHTVSSHDSGYDSGSFSSSNSDSGSSSSSSDSGSSCSSC